MTTFNTGNPIGSTDARDRLDNAANLDLAVNSLEKTFVDRLGVTRSTYEGAVQGLSFFNVGTFAVGFTLTNSRQTLTYDGHEYGWSGVFPKVVSAGSTPTPLGSGGWIDRSDVTLRGDIEASVFESLRRSYADAGFTLVGGSFESGGTLNNTNDVLLHKASGIAYSWAGAFPKVVSAASTPETTGGIGAGAWVDRTDETLRGELSQSGGAQIVRNSVRWFDSIQLMLAATDLYIGQKVCSGSTIWKITASNKGWPLANGAQYALPLNGVYIDDAGADPTGVLDSYSAIMYVINNYNADAKRRFTITSAGGYYKTSASIALHSATSYIRINLSGAILEATSNMASLISCPAITEMRLKSVCVQHATGVVIANAMIHINTESSNSNKTTRHVIDDITAGLFTGAPYLLLCDKMWESKIGRIRADRDVAGKTGEIVNLKSCVNCVIQPSEIGYCNVGWRLSKNTNVSYGCEGITFNGGVTTYAAIPVSGDFVTAVRLKGMVLDFCKTSGPVFSNGQDVSVEGCWIANTTDSAVGWNGLISLPTVTGIKIQGCHFANNSVNSANCASINSLKSSFNGNTSTGCLPGFRYAGEVSEYGNKYGINGVGINSFSGASFAFNADAGIAPSSTLSSGASTNSPNQLLQRLSFSAPLLNANNALNIDVFEGNFADQAYVKISMAGLYIYKLNTLTGGIELLIPGSGIVMTSPNGLVTKTLRLSNAGALELV